MTNIDTDTIAIDTIDIEDVYERRPAIDGGIWFGFSGRLTTGGYFDGDAWYGVHESMQATARAAGSARGMVDVYDVRIETLPEGVDLEKLHEAVADRLYVMTEDIELAALPVE